MQYWLLNYHNTCPDGWWASGTDCYTDSPTVQTPHQPITNLANLSVTGQTVAGGQDTFILSTGSALYAVQNSDSMLGLPNYWKSAEFNVFGDCCSSTAYFNSGSTIAVRTSVDSGVTTAPSCINDGWTGEQNNLYFQASSGTPRSSTQPAIVFTESTTETRTKPCDSAVAVPAASKLADTHDFNGDGFSDIVWTGTSGDIAVWLMNGAEVMLSGTPGTAQSTWSIVGQRDFNGDGTYDFLWRDTSGNTSIWFMVGTQVFSTGTIGNIPTTWSVAGVADFNGDGKGDILWRDSSGNTAVWLMNGASVLSTGSLGNIPTSFSVAGTGDFNGDGDADILWQDGSGNYSIWFMNGTAVTSTAAVGSVSTTWSVVGTGDFNARQDRHRLARCFRRHRDLADERRVGTLLGRHWHRAHDVVGRADRRLQWRRHERPLVARHQRRHRHLVHERHSGFIDGVAGQHFQLVDASIRQRRLTG
jgi:FG-GAP-like repeat